MINSIYLHICVFLDTLYNTVQLHSVFFCLCFLCCISDIFMHHIFPPSKSNFSNGRLNLIWVLHSPSVTSAFPICGINEKVYLILSLSYLKSNNKITNSINCCYCCMVAWCEWANSTSLSCCAGLFLYRGQIESELSSA